MNENFWILNDISSKFVLDGLIDVKSALVKVVTLCRIGDEPLLIVI